MSAPHVAATPDSRPGLTRTGMVVLLTGPFLANLDLFITNVALPSIAHDLHAPAGALELVASGYAVTYAAFLVLAGRLGDRSGRRRLFAVGLVAFTATSVLAGIAPTTTTLVLARFAQGAAAAQMTPQVLATLQTVFDGPARARAISRYAVAGGLSAVAGQLVGGALIAADLFGLGWRTVFLVNLPVGLVAVLLVRRTVPETRSPSRPALDLPGVVLLVVVLVGLLVPLVEGPTLGWPLWCAGMLVLAALAAVVLVAVERRTEQRGRLPLLPPALLRLPSMRRGLPVLAVFFLAVSGFLFAFALTSQDLLGLSAFWSGVAVTPVTIAYVATSFAVPTLLRRHGRAVLAVGGIVQGAGFAATAALVVSAPSGPPVVLVLIALALSGAGQALGVGALFRSVLADVPPHLAGVGGGVMVTVQQTALAFGVAVLGTLFTSLLPVGHAVAVLAVGAALVATQLVVAVAARTLPRLVS
ncbi:MFS transporter [Curtobacterium sp. 9128]|uniref:MFS transporter n=1 Tax=Curtobacterium sp. 9128 TaxID=1793722 RepID=UPI001642AF80|nr:MFS transporter [Curtobacterium sp. 9128]